MDFPTHAHTRSWKCILHRRPGDARRITAAGPVLAPGKVHAWSLVYDPTAAGGNGAVTVTLDQDSATLPLKKGLKAQGANFDRFGLFTSNIGGQIVRIYLDDLKYTAARTR